MEMDTLYQEILSAPLSPSLWDLGPEWGLNTGLLDNDDCGLLAKDDGGLLIDDESLWGNYEGIPLKEALLDSSGQSPGIDDQSIRDENPFADWLDVRVDLTELDEFVRSPEFVSVMHDLGETVGILDGMESSIGVEQDPLATEISTSTEVAEVPINLIKEDNSPSSSEASPSFFVEVTTSPPGSPGNELIGQPQQYINVIMVEGDSTVDTNDLNDSSSNFGSPSCSTKTQSSRKTRTAQRKARQKPYTRTSFCQNGDDGGTESSSSFDESHGCSARGPKERKKVQNRCAATRYRLKRRTEQSELDKEEAELVAKNKELSQKTDQLCTEIGYLKNLMRDMLVSKGLLKKE